MRVLVTGGAGFIGSHTVDLLLEKGYRVRVVDALKPPVHLNGTVPDYLPLKKIEFFNGDVRDRGVWEKALEDVDAVVHLAAYQDYLPDFSTFFHTNTVSTALLYEVIVAHRLKVKKVVVASSQAAYGEGAYECTTCRAKDIHPELRSEEQLKQGEWECLCPSCRNPLTVTWTDESIVKPHNQYAISKYTQELVSLNLGKRYGIPTVCMRYSIVQGPRQSFRNAYSGVLRIFVQRLLSGKPPVCYEDGCQMRDYVSVYDVVRANLLVMEDSRADYRVFNVGGGKPIRVVDYARLLAARCGVDIEPELPAIYRFGDTRHILSDIKRLKQLGWKPEVSFEEIVDGYIDWVKHQPGFCDYYSGAEAEMKKLGTLRTINQPSPQ